MDKCYKLHGFPLGFKLKNNKNATAHQVSSNLGLLQGNASTGITDFTSAVTASHALAFTHDQYQQLLALIGFCFTQPLPKGQETHVANIVALPSNIVAGNPINFKQETHVANIVALPSNIVAGNPINFKHSMFSTKMVNRRAYGLETWVIDTGASIYIVYSMQLLTSYTEISHTMVELPDKEVVVVTHIGTIQLSSHITLTNVLCVPSPSFTFNLLSVSALTKS